MTHAQLITYRLRTFPAPMRRSSSSALSPTISRRWIHWYRRCGLQTKRPRLRRVLVWRDKEAFEDFMKSPAAADIMGRPYIVAYLGRLADRRKPAAQHVELYPAEIR